MADDAVAHYSWGMTYGRIFRILEEFNGYQDPKKSISAFITALTGISDDMVKWQKINESAVAEYLEDVDLIIAHNAKFDRSFFEITFPNITPKARAIAWNFSLAINLILRM